MSSFSRFSVFSYGGSPVQAPPSATPEGALSRSLADLIVGFDLSPYLGGPLGEIWQTLQSYPLMLAAKIVHESGGCWVRHRIRLPIGVSYDSDMDEVFKVLKDIAAQNENVPAEPPPRVRVLRGGDNSINLELLCWIRRPEERGPVIHLLALEIIKRFRQESIQISFPQRHLHFTRMARGRPRFPGLPEKS